MSTVVPHRQTPDQMREVAKALIDGAGILSAVADGASENGFDSLIVTNYDQIRRAVQYVDNFTFAARTALRSAKEERGDFGQAEKDKTKKPAKKHGDK